MNFLHTSTSEYQPPLVLPITSEMVDEEEPRDAHGRVDGDLQDLASLECEGLSKVKPRIIHGLLFLVSICTWISIFRSIVIMSFVFLKGSIVIMSS